MYSDVHADIFRSMLKLRDSGGEVDTVIVAAQMESMGLAEQLVGGAIPYLCDLLETVPHAEHATVYAKKIRELYRRRQAITIAGRLMEQAYDLSTTQDDVSEAAVYAATELAEKTIEGTRIWTEEECVMRLLDDLESGIRPSENWFIPVIDEMTGGMAKGEMMVIGARPSHGKTMLAKQMVDVAAKAGHPGMIVSEEMSKASLASRSLQMITVIDSKDWMQTVGQLRFEAKQHFADRAPVYIVEKCGSIGAVEAAVAKAVRRHNIEVLAIDYAQLIKGAGDSEQERIADVSQRVKAMTTRYELRTILLAQLNRGLELRKDEPQLADLRGSGSLEQDGDVILFPLWPWKLDSNHPNPREYHIYQRKNRNRGIIKDRLTLEFNATRQMIAAMQEESGDDVDF